MRSCNIGKFSNKRYLNKSIIAFAKIAIIWSKENAIFYRTASFWLINLSIHFGLINHLVQHLVNWQKNQIIKSIIPSPYIAQLIEWFFEWLNDWLNDWLIDWRVDWMIDWLIDRLIGWLIRGSRHQRVEAAAVRGAAATGLQRGQDSPG